MCKVVNIRNADYTIYIGRAGHGQLGTFGNPFKVGVHGKQGECVELFRKWFHSPAGQEMRSKVDAIITKNDTLGCFCKPNACHGDVIAEYVNNRPG